MSGIHPDISILTLLALGGTLRSLSVVFNAIADLVFLAGKGVGQCVIHCTKKALVLVVLHQAIRQRSLIYTHIEVYRVVGLGNHFTRSTFHAGHRSPVCQAVLDAILNVFEGLELLLV